MNDEAATPTPSGAVVETTGPQGTTTTTVVPQTGTTSGPQTQSGSFTTPSFVFNVNGSTPSVPNQNPQTAPIGASGTPSAKPTEVQAPAPDVEEEDDEDEERPVRKDGKRYLPQEKVNSIVRAEVEKALQRATQEAENQKAEIERKAREAAATTLEDIRALWQEDKNRLELVFRENADLKNQITKLEQDILLQQSRTESYEDLLDTNVDRKVATWPEQLRALDPKAKKGKAWSTSEVQQRMQWMMDMEPIAQTLVQQQQAPPPPAAPTEPPAQGNGPAPEPQGNLDEEALDEFIKQDKERFMAEYGRTPLF